MLNKVHKTNNDIDIYNMCRMLNNDHKRNHHIFNKCRMLYNNERKYIRNLNSMYVTFSWILITKNWIKVHIKGLE